MSFEQRMQQESVNTLGRLNQLRQLVLQRIDDPTEHLQCALEITVLYVDDMYHNHHGECVNLDVRLEELHHIKADVTRALLLTAAKLPPTAHKNVMHRAHLKIMDDLINTAGDLSVLPYYWGAA